MNNTTPTCVDQEYESTVHGELLAFPVQELVTWSVRLIAPDWAQMWSSGHITGGRELCGHKTETGCGDQAASQGKGEGNFVGANWSIWSGS